AINSAGQVVGFAYVTRDGPNRAFLSNGTPGGMIDLNTLVTSGGSGWLLLSADGINDNGQIVGEGIVGDTQHAFLLTPDQSATAVPEPSSLAIWGLAALGLVIGSVRRRTPLKAARLIQKMPPACV